MMYCIYKMIAIGREYVQLVSDMCTGIVVGCNYSESDS